MIKGLVIFSIIILILLGIFIFYPQLSGNVVYSGTLTNFGPSQNEISCMMTCMGCSSPGVGCTGDSAKCQAQCNIVKPEETAEESCVSECTKKGCGEYDFSCQEKNQAVCDKECGMIKEPEAKSEEEQCIRDCVNSKSPGLICQAAEGGEKGNSICQECAESCEYLYAGPCLDELKLEAAKQACNTCDKCYGKPVMGNSGEGYECIIDVECADASSEFGDDSGTGPGIGQEGFVANIVESIGNFFSNLFSGE